MKGFAIGTKTEDPYAKIGFIQLGFQKISSDPIQLILHVEITTPYYIHIRYYTL